MYTTNTDDVVSMVHTHVYHKYRILSQNDANTNNTLNEVHACTHAPITVLSLDRSVVIVVFQRGSVWGLVSLRR